MGTRAFASCRLEASHVRSSASRLPEFLGRTIAAGLRPTLSWEAMNRCRIGPDIAVALTLKLALLALLYVLFFHADTRPRIDAEIAARHLFVPVSGAATQEDPQ